MIVPIADAVQRIRGNESGLFGFDLETTGFDPRKDSITWVSLSVQGPGTKIEAWAWPVVPALPDAISRIEALTAIRPLFEDPRLTCVGWNLAFDLQFIMQAIKGVEIQCRVGDGMLCSMLLDEWIKMPGLKETVRKSLGHNMQTYDEAGGLFGDFHRYSVEDAEYALRLWTESIWPRIQKDGKEMERLALSVEGEVVKIVAEMELHGLYVDKVRLEALLHKHETALKDVEARMLRLVGRAFDAESPKQVSDLLYSELQIPLREGISVGKSGVPSTNQASLEAIRDEHPIVPLILKYRYHSTVLKTFIRPWLKDWIDQDGRIHASFRQMGTETGRFVCVNPNLLAVSKNPWDGLRHAITVPPGKVLIQADWSQIELRFTAYWSEDPEMLSAYTGDDPKDIHQITMERTGCGDRRKSKSLNFGLLYGMGPAKLARTLGVTFEEADSYWRAFHATYAGMKPFRERIFRTIKERGYVTSMTGRRRRFSKRVRDSLKFMDDAHREAVNSVVQGSAGDLLKLSIRNLHREICARRRGSPLWHEVKIVSLIHDEMLVETPESIGHEVADRVRYHMENSVQLTTHKGPLHIVADVAIVTSWGEANLDADARAKEYAGRGWSDDRIQYFFPNQLVGARQA